MLVLLPSGNTCNIPNDTISRGAYATSAYPPVIANGGLMGAVSSGSMNPFLTSTYGTLLVQNASGTTVSWEQMDSNSAVTTAISQIMAALAGGCPAGTLATTGNFTWQAPGS